MSVAALNAPQPTPSMAVETCYRMVDAAAKSCAVPPAQKAPDWDAMANSFASLSAAFAWGSLFLALIAVIAGFAWGKIVTGRAEREARQIADAEVRKWLENVAPPLIKREINEFLRTFGKEDPISERDVDAIVTAAGADGKEDGDGKK